MNHYWKNGSFVKPQAQPPPPPTAAAKPRTGRDLFPRSRSSNAVTCSPKDKHWDKLITERALLSRSGVPQPPQAKTTDDIPAKSAAVVVAIDDWGDDDEFLLQATQEAEKAAGIIDRRPQPSPPTSQMPSPPTPSVSVNLPPPSPPPVPSLPPPPVPSPAQQVQKPKRRLVQELPSASTTVESREKIFQKMDQMVELQHQLILPTLDLVVKSAPPQIMKRLVRSIEIKSAFPGVVDSMFQWGMEQERKLARLNSGLKEPKPPILPSRFESGLQYYTIKNSIATGFEYGGTWGALKEVRSWLENILKSLEGNNRFRLYEHNTLANFWRLLFWANELWKGLLFEEEENEQLVLKNKSRWVKELRVWTGLVLKSDWRDYFVVDLEIEIRKLTLGILENIVSTGYFEQKINRYEILYRILKDVLIRDAFRNISNVQHVLRIVNWSVPDSLIINHLCYKTNETNTCLARLIGENALRVCREARSTDSVSLARLYLDYAKLLETLMSESPAPCHQSKYARQISDSNDDGDYSSMPQLPNSEEMLVDDDLMAASQFACPIKYNVQPIIEPMETDEEDSLGFWLDPCKYEDPFGKLKVCQCRKVLMGTAISLLKIIFDAWSQKYLDYDKKEEENLEILELKELSGLEFNGSVLQGDRLDFLQKKKVALMGEEFQLQKQRLPDREWNLDDSIRRKKKKRLANETDKSALPNCITEMKRVPDVFDQALSKGVILMNFIQERSENLAAALGTDAYKTFMMLKALLRLHVDHIHFSRIERDLLIAMTPECDEDHLGPALTNNPSSSVAYPIPLSPLNSDIPQEDWGDLADQSEKELQAFVALKKPSDEEMELRVKEGTDYDVKEFCTLSGPYTYRPIVAHHNHHQKFVQRR